MKLEKKVTGDKKLYNLKYGLMILIVAAFWGFGNPAMKISVEAISPMYALVLRFFLAFILFLSLKFRHIKNKIKSEDYKNMFIVAGFVSGAYIAAAYALSFTTATNAGFFMATGVIYTPFISFFVMKDKIKWKSLFPIGIVVLGMYFLSTASGSMLINPGDFIALICALFGSGMYVFTGRYAARTDPIVASALQFLFVTLICLPFALILEPIPNLLNLSSEVWISILFMSIFCTCLAYFVQNLALKHVSPTYTALVFSTEPIFGSVASFFILGEVLGAKGLLGAGVIMIGIVLATLLEA
ncbi:MAG: DMT family transporter [Filifactoraceae bacterium]